MNQADIDKIKRYHAERVAANAHGCGMCCYDLPKLVEEVKRLREVLKACRIKTQAEICNARATQLIRDIDAIIYKALQPEGEIK